jgi:hypothetical protein
MRFMTIYKPGKETTAPPTEKEMADMGKLIEEMAKAGVLLAADGLQPSSQGARVRIDGEKFTVTDGPFTESKELVAGFAILQVKSKAEAIEWTKRFLNVVGKGVSEIRLMHDVPAFPAEAKRAAR